MSPIDAAAEKLIPWFLRLRAVYFVLSRRFAFGTDPTDEQREQMETFRARVGPEARLKARLDGAPWLRHHGARHRPPGWDSPAGRRSKVGVKP